MNHETTLDVSGLPESTQDHRSEIWWGNLLLIAIETTMFALLVAGYLYVRPNFAHWPPPQSESKPPLFDPVPELGLPTVNLVLLLLTLVPAIVADRACLQQQRQRITWALAIFIALAVGCIALRFREFTSLHFRWDDNAYASFAWTIVGMHLLHLIAGTLEFVMMLTWIVLNGLDDKHARDVRVTTSYWYWVVGVWIVLYAIVFPGPRFF